MFKRINKSFLTNQWHVSFWFFSWALHAQRGLNKTKQSSVSPLLRVCEIVPALTSLWQKQRDQFVGVWILDANLWCCDLTAPQQVRHNGKYFSTWQQNCFFSEGKCLFPLYFPFALVQNLNHLYMEMRLVLPNQQRRELQEPMGRQTNKKLEVKQQNSETLGEA